MLDSVAIPVGDQTHQAYLALPEAKQAPFPGVVVIHDIFGFSPDLRRHCERFAEAGYAAIGPDLYRGGNPGCVVKTLLSMTSGAGLAYQVIESARIHLADRRDVDADRIGVVGFCMGGGFALVAGADQSFAVAAPFYGAVPRSASRLKGLCPTIAQYGAEDTIYLSHAKRLVGHLEELGIEHEIHIYEGVGHSFMNDHGARPLARWGRHTPIHAFYDSTTEARAWSALLDFFERHAGKRESRVSPSR